VAATSKGDLNFVVTSPQIHIFTKIPLWDAKVQKCHYGMWNYKNVIMGCEITNMPLLVKNAGPII